MAAKKNDHATLRGHVRDCSLGAQGILLVEQFDVEFQYSWDASEKLIQGLKKDQDQQKNALEERK